MINITKIGEKNFSNSTNAYPNLQNVILSPTVKKLDGLLFYKVATLKTINLESVENIGTGAFGESGVEKVAFEQSNIIIGESAFGGCQALTEIKIKGNAVIR